MNEILAAIEKHLKRPLKASQLDYYQVIGLEPFCADKSAIESALKIALEQIRTSESSTPANQENSSQAADPTGSLQVVQKLLRQAQSILLDTSKKTAYDSQLAKLFESQKKQKELGKNSSVRTQATVGIVDRTSNKPSAGTSSPTIAPNASELLPLGDPMLPFNAASIAPDSFARANSALNLTPEKRRAELSELFPSLMLMSIQPEPTHEQPPAWLVAADRKPSAKASTLANASTRANPNGSFADKDQQDAAKRTDTKSTDTKRVDLVEQLRSRRRRRNLLAVGGMVLAALGLLGFASFRFVSNRQQVAQQDRNKPAERPTDNALGNALPGANPSNTKTPDLNIGATTKGRNRKGANELPLPELPSVGFSEPDASSPATDNPAMAKPPVQMPPDAASTPEPAPEPVPEPAPETTTEPTPAPTPEPAMANETPEWKAGMAKAKEALVSRDPGKFEPLIAAMLDKATTKLGKDQTARLDQAGQLLKIYAESFEEAKLKAKGASSLKVGATEVSIVESTPEKLIVRAQGKNQSYEWDKLPFGIAAAICDLGLSDSAPVDIAARAIFFSIHPFYQEAAKSNNLVTKRIDGWFERSLGKESIRADLKQFLTDRYE
jgi:hypothetical protein